MITPQIPLSSILARVPAFADVLTGRQAPEPDLERLESALDTGTYLGWSPEFNERVACAEINTWRCTDTWVGVHAYYFDGEFVALSFQNARKNGKVFRWVSREAANQMRAFIRTLAEGELEYLVIDPADTVSADWLREREKR